MRKPADLFLDLDGVLADFDAHVEALFRRRPEQLPISELWRRAAGTPGFFETMPCTQDADELWSFCAPFEPTILTGLPRGRWAEPQKRNWVVRHLGTEVPVATCMAREKSQFATPGAVLVDDSTKFAHLWVEGGGVFVHHVTAERSIIELRRLGFEPT